MSGGETESSARSSARTWIDRGDKRVLCERGNMIKYTSKTKEHFGWKMAILQHPMYLVIDEDRGEPILRERTAPWGAPNASEYVGRILRNLESLEKLPDLRLNYQFSGVELEAMAQGFPDVTDKMRELYHKGVLDFVGGSFSQPHLHTFGSESNWRQFEFGLKILEDLFGKEVKVYARQETGLHQQLSQILAHFGYEFMVTPTFPWAMEITGGKMEVTGFAQGLDTVAGDEFIEAEALDGTCLPMYVKVVDSALGATQSALEMKELYKDLYGGPPIWIHIPDLMEIDDDTLPKFIGRTYKQARELYDFVLLEEALRNRFAQAPPRARARFYTYWSYIEGVWAEELLRKNKAAEEAAVLAEFMCQMVRLAGVEPDKSEELQQIWHTILKYQHHDVSWNEVTDLRRRAIDLLDAAIAHSHRIIIEIARQLCDKDDTSLAVFNGLPEARRCYIETTEDQTPEKGGAFQKHGERCFGFLDLPAGGFRSFTQSEDSCSAPAKAPLPKEITTDAYRLEFCESGLIAHIATRDGQELLRAGEYLGGEIRALVGDRWVDNRSADCRFYSGDVAYVLERDTSLGRIPVTERYLFFKHEPFMKAEVEFAFDGDEVGDFYVDETKINIYYPSAGQTDVYLDIPFGYVKAREQRPLFATNWLYCGGLVYVNRGNVKHWVRDGVIANVIAWGDQAVPSRVGFGTTMTEYDLRLYGKQKIEYFLMPYGAFDGNRIVKDVYSLTFPVFVAKGRGERSFYEVKDRNLVVTSLYDRGGQIWARGYKLPSDYESRFGDWEIFNCRLDEIE